MARSALAEAKINTNPTQPGLGRASGRARYVPKSRAARGKERLSGDPRESVRDAARVVVEMECGILVYPPES
jgi:hypothetical protein